jgi:hypothetical protein
MKFIKLLFVVLAMFSLASGARAELQDQGLKSIMDIIDKAISELAKQASETDTASDPEALEGVIQNATSTVVNLSRTLGTLSYSRLQCGQAEVLSEFTQRVQLMPEESRDLMRDAFQEGFDKSKDETALLSEDECQRLTRSRIRTETIDDVNVTQGKTADLNKLLLNFLNSWLVGVGHFSRCILGYIGIIDFFSANTGTS